MANTILLKGDLGDGHEESVASGIVYPGYLVSLDGDGKVLANSVRGGQCEKNFVKEDALQGKTVDDAYAVGDPVFYHKAKPGDVIQAVLHAGENVNEGDRVISYGDGTLCKAASSYLANNAADSTTVTNTVAETTFSNGTVTIPANTLKVGDVLRIRGSVAFPSTNSTDTASVKVKIGSTVVLTIPATDVANDDVAYFDVTIVVRTIGASGTIVAVSQYSVGVLGTATTRTQTLNSTTLDTTAAASLTVTVTWSVASASNQAILRTLLVEKVAGSPSGSGTSGGFTIGYVVLAVDLSISVTNGFVKIRVA